VSAEPARILPVGDAALTVELGRTLDPDLNARVRALDEALRARPFAGLLESVPAYASLLCVYDPGRGSFGDARAAIERLLDVPAAAPRPGARHVVPVRYGGEHGPDLGEVARAHGLSEREAIQRHTAAEYTALFVGFLPGYAYLGMVSPELEMPRRAAPRARVPAGSVAVAGRLTGVYPFASPGGWNLIGRTERVFFDPFASEPALVQAGDRVRFLASDLPVDADYPRTQPFPASMPVIEVVDGGLLTTVQDGGRRGHRRLGVPWCGFLDPEAAHSANRAVGNPESAALLECTATGPTLRFAATTRFAVAGADLGAILERADLGPWPVPNGRAVVARPGNVLSMRDRRSGLRAYVAFAGGITVPVVLGSRSTDLVAGFGGYDGRALKADDHLSLGRAPAAEAADVVLAPPAPGPVVLRAVAGPQDDMFTEEARARLESETFAVGALSDRIGCRLEGPVLAHRAAGEILTDGMVPGCIQVPPSGQPIVMLGGGPTTGGYPKIATVVSADLGRLGQALAGDPVRFRLVTVEEAQRTRPGTE
jgi:KipI family sensor histidine kinase inhibitor